MVTWSCFFFLLKTYELWFFFRFRSWKITGLPSLEQLEPPNWERIEPDQCYWLYLILCENNKYYVGITNDLERRCQEEFSQGSRCPKWLLRHKPIRYLGILPLETRSRLLAEKVETAFTKSLFKKYGRRNVRGGRYASPSLFS